MLDGLSSQRNIQKQKATLQKQAVSVKTQQKEMQTAMLELGPCMCYAFASIAESCVHVEQIEADIASAREALSEASAGIDKMRKELKSLVDKIAKCEVRDTHFLPLISAPR